ncbi:MAG: hypothetical protein MHM6MM_002857 [Cercozoa sp. M6MM]
MAESAANFANSVAALKHVCATMSPVPPALAESPLPDVLQLAQDCGFEGSEKKLEVWFEGGDLRAITRPQWDQILTVAKCEILSTVVGVNNFCHAYLLSESSLFVMPNRIVIKTCGTTRLLRALSLLLQTAASVGARAVRLSFSRCHFLFPQAQTWPHRNFTSERSFLDSLLSPVFAPGRASVLGAIGGPRHHFYLADTRRFKRHLSSTMELVMFNLDPEVMRLFYRDASSLKCDRAAGNEVTECSKLCQVFPRPEIWSVDAFAFQPCGYSCNAVIRPDLVADSNRQEVQQDAYWTVHVTPEPTHSFVSFETNLRGIDLGRLVAKVVGLFRPALFSVVRTSTTHGQTAVDGGTSVLDSLDGTYDCVDRVEHQLCAEHVSVASEHFRLARADAMSPSHALYQFCLRGVSGV